MPNTKTALKRMKQSRERRIRNKAVKTRIKTEVKYFLNSLKKGDRQEAEKYLSSAKRIIDKAANKGVIHKNEAARKKSRLTKMLNKAG